MNVIGQNVAEFRCQRGWTLEELAAKLRLLGCKITPCAIANIETQRCTVTDAQIVFLSQVFCISVEELFPSRSDVD